MTVSTDTCDGGLQQFVAVSLFDFRFRESLQALVERTQNLVRLHDRHAHVILLLFKILSYILYSYNKCMDMYVLSITSNFRMRL